MTNSIVYIAETPASIALTRVSNLVELWRDTRLESSIPHDSPVYTTSQSRSQRRINVDRASFRNGVARLLRPVRENGASVISGQRCPDPFDAGEFTPKECRKPTCEQNRTPFTKASSYDRCFTRTRLYSQCRILRNSEPDRSWSQVDRSQHCMPEGLNLLATPFIRGSLRVLANRQKRGK